jgi:hypothetical protein
MVNDPDHVLDVKDHYLLWKVNRKHPLIWLAKVQDVNKRASRPEPPASPLFNCYLWVKKAHRM